MKEVLPEAYEKFLENVEKLEHYFKDMQDVEFTVEKGKSLNKTTDLKFFNSSLSNVEYYTVRNR